ncbi:MAG: TrmH family RNA methyltransferase, partial [Bacteroidales bacterium]
PQNASAVLRSCEAFGVQNVHIIEHHNTFTLHKDIAMGTQKWLSLHKYKNPNACATQEAIKHLRQQNYRIVATTPHNRSVSLEEFDVQKGKFALLFGTEHTGLSDEALKLADEFLYIPTAGFVESLNISVCAAIIVHHLSLQMKVQNVSWKLTDAEQDELLANWLRKSVYNSEKILERRYKDLQN